MAQDVYRDKIVEAGIQILTPDGQGVILGYTEIGLLIRQEDTAPSGRIFPGRLDPTGFTCYHTDRRK